MTDNFIDADIGLKFDKDTLTRKVTQHIPDSFLDRLKTKRDASRNAPMGNFHHLASIPTAVVEKWQAEGFNIFDQNVSVQEIMKRLRTEDMQKFFASDRKI
jgi:hypothetical protein